MVFEFGGYRLDPAQLELTNGGEAVSLEPQVFDVLTYLVERRERVVTKEELLDEVWGDRFVSESTLSSRVAAARAAIGDSGREQWAIRTVHGRGFRFVADVVMVEPTSEPTVLSVAPTSNSGLIGRERDLEAAMAHLAASRLVTLTGPGGVGKTSLAAALLEQPDPSLHSDGSWFVELVAVNSHGVIDAVATALDVQQRQGLTLLASLVEVLADSRSILVLDNCEHVIGTVSELVSALLAECPQLRIVATSRESLQVGGEQVYPVPPLDCRPMEAGPPPAVELFEARARAVDPSFRLEEANAEVVGDICLRLDGLPLAIELAAARTRAIDLTELADRLDQRFRVLKGSRRSGDERHRTLLDTIRWSYDLLDSDQRNLFCQLSVFAGPFDLSAAESVCETTEDVVDPMFDLVDRSMVSVRRVGNTSRFEVLESLRAFGVQQLTAERRSDLAARHCAHYLDMSSRAAIGLDTADEGEWTRDLGRAFENLRTAHRYAIDADDADSALGIATGIREYAMRVMRYEVMAWAAEAARIAPEEHPLHSTALGMAAYGSFVRGEFAAAVEMAERANAVEQQNPVAPSGLVQRVLANCDSLSRDFEGLRDGCERQLAIAQDSGSPGRLAHAAYMFSAACTSTGVPDRAAELAEMALEAAARSASPTAMAGAQYAIAFQLAESDASAARGHAESSDELARSVQNRWMSAFARGLIGSIDLLTGDLESASRIFSELVDVWYRAGDWSQTWLTLGQSVVALERSARHEAAATVIGAINDRAAIGAAPSRPTEQHAIFASMSILRETLGDEDFQRLSAEGAATSLGVIVQQTRAALAD